MKLRCLKCGAKHYRCSMPYTGLDIIEGNIVATTCPNCGWHEKHKVLECFSESFRQWVKIILERKAQMILDGDVDKLIDEEDKQ